VPLWIFAIPPVLTAASWLTQHFMEFDTATPGAIATAGGFVAGVFGCLWSVVVLVRRLIVMPASRSWPTYVTLGASGAVFVVPLILFIVMAIAWKF
jgi:hypothetical protein